MKKLFLAIMMSVGCFIYAQNFDSEVEKMSFPVMENGVESVVATDIINLYTRLAVDYIRFSKQKFVPDTKEAIGYSDYISVNYSEEFGPKPQNVSAHIERSTKAGKGTDIIFYTIHAEIDGKAYDSKEGLVIIRKKGKVVRNDIVEYKTAVVKKEFPNLYK